MDEFNLKIFQMVDNLQRKTSENNEYHLIANFGKSNVATEDSTAKPFFRIFTPVKPEKHRKLNSIYGEPFDIINDSLLDYPTIIRYKLGKTDTDWRKFNRLISVHISECPLSCWHCYLEECVKNSCEYCNRNDCDKTRKNALEIERGWFSAKFIVDSFIEQREIDASNGIESNVLRITGGEPLLIPNFLLEILNEIKARGLDKEIFVWTETNLIPLIVKNEDYYLITDVMLSKLAEFNNFCVHPCFHGLDENEFRKITGCPIEDFNVLFEALQRLIDNKIDVYPSFGSNVSKKSSIELFFRKISEIDPLLPLRFALIEYTNYPAISIRKESFSSLGIPQPNLYEKKEALEIWNQLLIGMFKRKYTELPRHLIPYSKDEDLIHLFKWPSKVEFQQKLLEIISLPTGSSCQVKYDDVWLNDYFEVKYLDKSKIENKNAIFWILSCAQVQKKNEIKTNFVFAYPFRKVRIKNIQRINKTNYFDIIVLDYFERPRKMVLNDLKSFTKIPFNDGNFPYPGLSKGFVFLGNPQELSNFSFSKDIDLQDLYKILSEIPALNSVNIKIVDYPLIKIEDIKLNSPTFWDKIRKQVIPIFNQNGELQLKMGKQYNIIYNFYQGDEENKRTRQISINSQNFIGKSGRNSILISPVNANKFKVEIIAGELDYNIDLPFKIDTQWHKKNWVQYSLLTIISIFLFAMGYFVFHLDNTVLATAVIPIIVVFIEKILR